MSCLQGALSLPQTELSPGVAKLCLPNVARLCFHPHNCAVRSRNSRRVADFPMSVGHGERLLEHISPYFEGAFLFPHRAGSG